LSVNIKKIKKIAAKKTIIQAKKELLNLKKKKIKIDPKEFEDYVKSLYKKNLEEVMKENKK